MLEKHSITITGHHTSISLEPEFWDELKSICKAENKSLGKMIAEIDDMPINDNLSSKIRVFILKKIKGLH